MTGCGGEENGGGSGGDNDQVNGSDSTPPTDPANLQASAISDTRIDLSWDASSDNTAVAGYRIYRDGSFRGTTDEGQETYSDTGLTAETTYTYTVSAYDAAGNESGESEGASGTTLADNVIYAASCEQADVQAAIDSAVDGDTVMVPAGECTWTTFSIRTPSVQIVQKAITLQGAGIDKTVITDSTGSLVKEVPLSIDGQEGKPWRVTGFTFKGADTDIDYKGVIVVDGTSKSWRIDHCKFYDLKTTAIRTYGHTYGVIDHNEFIRQYVESDIYITHDGWGGESYGDGSWNSPLSLGTEQAIYIEDNTFTWNGGDTALMLLDAKAGGRLVFRYNTVYESGLGSHGTESGGRNRSVRSYEIYNNEFIRSITQSRWTVFHIRGGTGVIFNNTITGNYNSLATVANFRDYHAFNVWGTCDGTNPYDVNDGVTYDSGTHTGGDGESVLTSSDKNWISDQWIGYSLHNLDKNDSSIITSNTENTITVVPDGYAEDVIWDTGDSFIILRASICIDQIGRSTGNLLSDDNPQWPQQALEPLYEWNNTINGKDANIKSTSPHIQENRDYYNDTPRPDYTPYTYPHPLTLASSVGNVYYVSPSGTASWAECTDINTPCSLATANTNAIAGETVYLRGGTYNTKINPTNSGTSGNVITYQAYTTETPIITPSGQWDIAITLTGDDYIKIDGLTIQDAYGWASIRAGSDYNEIVNCTFTDEDGIAASKSFKVWGQCPGGSPYTCPSTNNWIHNNTFSRMGWVDAVDCQDIGGIMNIGTITVGDSTSNYNTIEDNVMYAGGHHILEINSKYNAVRNNVMHNEGWMTDPGNCDWGPSPRNGKYGNRNIQLFNQDSADRQFTLLENNRFGHAAFASDGGMDGNIVIASRANIVRYNYAYHSETIGIYFKNGSGPADAVDNRVYNNTVYSSGQDSQIYPDAWTGWGDKDWRLGVHLLSSELTGNIFMNNIVYNSFTKDIACNTTCQSNNIFTDNWVTANGDPLFVNTDVSDPTSTTLPDLRVNSGSGVIDDGVNLTQANGSGTSSTTLIVDDALYFQDGSRGSSLSNIQADWIAIGTVSNTVQISSINYSTNTITLTSPMTWSDNASIWVYKDSAGRIVLRGSAPDVGAYEYVN